MTKNKCTVFWYNKHKYTFDTNKSRLLKCPFKNCDDDCLGYLGGPACIHRCYRHGLISMDFYKRIVKTEELLDNQTWSMMDLIDRGVLEINLYKDNKLIFTTKRGNDEI